MKNKSFLISLVFGLVFLLNVGSLKAQPQTIPVILDTITNTEVDTILMPWVLDAKGDLYDVSYQIFAVQGSGTTNLKIKHVVSNSLTGNNWTITTDSLQLSGTSNGLIQVKNVPNARSGIRIVGTGTQVSRLAVYPRLIRRE